MITSLSERFQETSPEDFKRRGRQPRAFIIGHGHRFLVQAFVAKLEYAHYLDTKDELFMMVMTWQEHPWAVLSVPRADFDKAVAVAESLDLRLAPGWPYLIDAPVEVMVTGKTVEHMDMFRDYTVSRFPLIGSCVYTIEWTPQLMMKYNPASADPAELEKIENDLVQSIRAGNTPPPPPQSSASEIPYVNPAFYDDAWQDSIEHVEKMIEEDKDVTPFATMIIPEEAKKEVTVATSPYLDKDMPLTLFTRLTQEMAREMKATGYILCSTAWSLDDRAEELRLRKEGDDLSEHPHRRLAVFVAMEIPGELRAQTGSVFIDEQGNAIVKWTDSIRSKVPPFPKDMISVFDFNR